jgi:hypothetical protein
MERDRSRQHTAGNNLTAHRSTRVRRRNARKCVRRALSRWNNGIHRPKPLPTSYSMTVHVSRRPFGLSRDFYRIGYLYALKLQIYSIFVIVDVRFFLTATLILHRMRLFKWAGEKLWAHLGKWGGGNSWQNRHLSRHVMLRVSIYDFE